MELLKNFLTLLLVFSAYYVCLGIYRVWFSPVAAIPGPLLAKLTYWYEFYWDVVRVGQYTFHIRRLHDQYGPIIRLNPHEVHIDDPDFYDEVFIGASTGRKREKWYYLMSAFGLDESTFSTIEHDRHRVRRAALSPFFSKAKIRALQGRVENIITRLLTRIRGFQQAHEPMPIGIAFTAMTHDIASAYAVDRRDFRIDARDFAPDFHHAAEKLEKSTHLMKQFPWLLKLINAMPVAWVTAMDPDMGAMLAVQIDLQKQTTEIQAAHDKPDYKSPEQITILHEILESTETPNIEKTHTRLWQDAESIIVAGTITTTTTLSNLLLFLLSDPTRFRRVREELFSALPDKNAPLHLPTLTNLVYLTACIRETLRVSNGLSSRIQRIDPEKPVLFHARKQSYAAPSPQEITYNIPPGTPMSMTALLIHLNPRIYPDPYTFRPERWLELDPTTGHDRIHHTFDKYFVPFSKGARACVGLNLAEAELYLTAAIVFRRYGAKDCQMPGDEGYMELFDSSYERDIEIIGDGFTPMVREPLKGVKIMIRDCDPVE